MKTLYWFKIHDLQCVQSLQGRRWQSLQIVQIDKLVS